MILLSMVMCSPNRASKNSKMMPRTSLAIIEASMICLPFMNALYDFPAMSTLTLWISDSKAGVEATEKGSHNRSWKGKAVVVGSETSGNSMIPKYKFFDFLRFHGHADPSGWLNRDLPSWDECQCNLSFGPPIRIQKLGDLTKLHQIGFVGNYQE
ncbi:hypothetical protein T459_05086 [Capsicum annuum]|uniref:Uncharacterized protein n=1 Tax=Capsicum annuum TaxID=4072 RepID=A0A2G3A708_CAPAN|nr:hypothetical protein T459_05086 [Capsicum annuum]